MNKKRFSKNKKYAGFSYAESILAVFIVSFEMLVVASLMSSSLKESMDSRNQIIGVLLSQEGIELVRNLRDNNWAKGDDTFTDFPTVSNDWCRVNIDNIIGCAPTYTDRILRIRSSDKAYYHNATGTATKFRRVIKIDYDAQITQAEITSIVSWGVWDANMVNLTDTVCNSSAKCAYTTTTLTRWGGM